MWHIDLFNHTNGHQILKYILIIIGSDTSVKIVKSCYKFFKKKKEKKRSTVEYSLEVQRDIEDQLLNDLKIITNADRAYVSIFHNGDESSTGLHFNKLTMMYESVKTEHGVSSQKHKFKGIAIEYYADRMRFLMKNKYRIVLDTAVMDNDETKAIILDKGVKSYFILMIKDRKNKKKPLCTIGIDYTDISNREMSDKQLLKELAHYGQRVAYRLTEDKRYLKQNLL